MQRPPLRVSEAAKLSEQSGTDAARSSKTRAIRGRITQTRAFAAKRGPRTCASGRADRRVLANRNAQLAKRERARPGRRRATSDEPRAPERVDGARANESTRPGAARDTRAPLARRAPNLCESEKTT